MDTSILAPRHQPQPTATMRSLVQHIRFQDVVGQQQLREMIKHTRADEKAPILDSRGAEPAVQTAKA